MAELSVESAVARRLRDAGCVFAAEEAALLIAESATAEELEVAVRRRAGGEPLEQVLGWADFHGLRITVSQGVFVPRRRSEALVDLAVELLGTVGPAPIVVDLCCGSGAIGVAVAAAAGCRIELHAADLDPAAVACARRNVTDGQVHEGDLFDALPAALRGRVDLIVANAPYVPTAEIRLMPPEARLHEHRVALDGGDDGLALHGRIASGAAHWLSRSGTLLLETSRHQAEATAAHCRTAGLIAEVVVRDDVDAVVVRAISDPGQSSGTMAG